MSSENEIWQAYAKTVKRIDKKITRKRTSVPLPLAGGVRGGRRPNQPYSVSDGKTRPPSVPPASGREAQKQTTFDRRIERSLRLGEIEIEARIDLHGMTQAKAYAALTNFMAAQSKRGHRYLLVITGKGKNTEGTLRSNLPHWLQSLPEAPQILTLRPAAPKHGGAGAFYVMLKRKK